MNPLRAAGSFSLLSSSTYYHIDIYMLYFSPLNCYSTRMTGFIQYNGHDLRACNTTVMNVSYFHCERKKTACRFSACRRPNRSDHRFCLPTVIHVSVDGNTQHNAQSNIICQHRSPAMADKRQRHTRYRQQSNCHADIFNEMKSQRRAHS